MDAATIKRCAELCAASYDDADSRFVTIDELRFGIVTEDDQTFLVFRGTDNFEGWVDDFTVIPTRTHGGYIAHKGFVDAADKLRAAISSAQIPPDKDVIITGHSLGGALAVLFGELFGVHPVVTFGCPRVYSRLNSGFPLMQHWRYVNQGDPVPEVPNAITWRHLCGSLALGPESHLDRDKHDIGLYITNIKDML